MANLVKTFTATASLASENMGTLEPPWFPNFVKSTWYYDTADVIEYFYNIENNERVFVQYGQESSRWGSARFFGEQVVIDSEVENADGSITADVTVTPLFFNGRIHDYSVGNVSVVYDVRVNNQTVYSYSGDTADSFTNGEGSPLQFSVTVQPEQISHATAFQIFITYPNGEFVNNSMFVGISLRNPNLAQYKPMATRKSNQWRDLNTQASAKIQIRKSSVWTDKSFENNATSRQANTGKNRIRKSGTFRQLPKMQNGTAP